MQDMDEIILDIEAGDGDWKPDEFLLLSAALLRPALFAPGANLATLLDRAIEHIEIRSYREFCAALAQFAVPGAPLSAGSLVLLQSQSAFDDELGKLREEVRAWYEGARNRTIHFPRATNLWRAWMRPGHAVHLLVQPVIEDLASAVSSLRERIEQWDDPLKVRRHVDDEDRGATGNRGLPPIEARALARLQTGVEEAIGFARRWLSLRAETGNIPRPTAREKKLHGLVTGQAERIMADLIPDLTASLSKRHALWRRRHDHQCLVRRIGQLGRERCCA